MFFSWWEVSQRPFVTHKLPGHKDRCLQHWLQRFLSTHFFVFYCRLWKWLCLPRFKTHSLIFRLVKRFLTNRPVHWIISFTVMLLYSFNFISISCRNQTLLLEFERIFVNWVEDGNLSANLMGMFGIFFFFYLLSCLSSFLIVYSKMYASFTPTILVADECRDAIMETTFLPKSPHVYSDPYLWKFFLSAGVGLASEVPSKLIQKQPPEVFYKKRCS